MISRIGIRSVHSSEGSATSKNTINASIKQDKQRQNSSLRGSVRVRVLGLWLGLVPVFTINLHTTMTANYESVVSTLPVM